VLGVEGASFGMGEKMTAAVASALDGLVESVLRELEEAPCTSAH